MKSRPAPTLRLTVATLCAFTLAVPAQAREPEPPPISPGEATDELSPRAEEHVVKALQQYEGGNYPTAEQEFKRAAFFAPKWRPLHFNLGVLAEAQGKLGTAVREYQTFKPLASADEGMVVDQRIAELTDRRKRIASGYKRQIATSAIAMSLGVLTLGAGGLLIGLAAKNKKTVASNKDMIIDDGMTTPDEQTLLDRNSALDSQRSKFLYGSYITIVVGVLAVAYSLIPLTRSIKSKRQLDGLALGPTRLHWDGGAGVRLRF